MSDESTHQSARGSRRTKHLAAFLYGAHVGEVSQDTNGNPAFVYDEQWSTLPNAVPLSLSMSTNIGPIWREANSALSVGPAA